MGPLPVLSYQEHIAWIREESEWFATVPDEFLDRPVPNCPKWDVAAVFDHLARGGGIAWRTWFTSPADIDGMSVMTGLPPATTGRAAKKLYLETVPDWIDVMAGTPEDKPCFWFSGPVPARWLVWLQTNEISTHRADVAAVLGRSQDLHGDRAADALAISAEFLPEVRARRRPDEPTPGTVLLHPTDRIAEMRLGTGDPVAMATGTASDLRLRLWGRPAVGEITVEGDITSFDEWTTTTNFPSPLG
ncbi:MAG: maleylpyruvate isomerase family mycothiol-dependent enzyme [Acidimicrobiia bacterium]|nr:maleylpyruvate isomerase family mycothiol-dependent enzyme [Acidimicrobiia bacterium]